MPKKQLHPAESLDYEQPLDYVRQPAYETYEQPIDLINPAINSRKVQTSRITDNYPKVTGKTSENYLRHENLLRTNENYIRSTENSTSTENYLRNAEIFSKNTNYPRNGDHFLRSNENRTENYLKGAEQALINAENYFKGTENYNPKVAEPPRSVENYSPRKLADLISHSPRKVTANDLPKRQGYLMPLPGHSGSSGSSGGHSRQTSDSLVESFERCNFSDDIGIPVDDFNERRAQEEKDAVSLEFLFLLIILELAIKWKSLTAH